MSWDILGRWAASDRRVKRTSVAGQDDDLGDGPGRTPPVDMRLMLQPEHVAQAERHFDGTRTTLASSQTGQRTRTAFDCRSKSSAEENQPSKLWSFAQPRL